MSEPEQNKRASESNAKTQSQEEREEPGLFSQVGSFPYIILKIIQMITPDFLITKKPPKKDYRI